MLCFLETYFLQIYGKLLNSYEPILKLPNLAISLVGGDNYFQLTPLKITKTHTHAHAQYHTEPQDQ